MDTATEQRCTRCKALLELAAFSPSQIGKLGAWCKACHNEHRRQKRAGIVPARASDICLTCGADIRQKRAHALHCSPGCAAKHWRANNPGRHRELMLKSLYGLTADEFDELLTAQSGRCAICRSSEHRGIHWNVDHDHATGAVRGLLCTPCNTALGLFADDPVRLRRAAEYLGAI